VDGIANLQKFVRKVVCFPISRFRSTVSAGFKGLLRGLPLQAGYYYFPEVKKWVMANVKHYDAVFCFHVRMTEYVINLDVVKVVDLVDAISMNYASAQDTTPDLKWRLIYRLELPRLLKYEQRVVSTFDKSILTSDVDRSFLGNHGANADRIAVVPNGTDLLLETSPDGLIQDIDILFQGNMRTQANQAAALYFVTRVLPVIRSRGQNPKVYIVGMDPPERIRKLSDGENVVVTGLVKDVSAFIRRARVVVAPMQIGAGVQNKILEAMALERPVVTTALGAEGIEGVHGVHYLVADGESEFSSAVISLLDDPMLRKSIGSSARQLIASKYTWENVGRRLIEEVKQAIAR